MMRAILARFALLASAGLVLLRPVPAAALSVQDYLNVPPTVGDTTDLRRYLTGFRDGLYDFNALLDSIGVKVFCPAPGTPPMDVNELRHRIGASLDDKRATETDFN